MADFRNISDNFNNNNLNAAQWNAGGASGSETNRRYEIVAQTGGVNFSDLITDIAHSLDEQAVFVEMSNIDLAAAGVQAGLFIEPDLSGDDQAMMYVNTATNNLVLRKRNGGANDETTVAYDATNHRWLRIREAGGTIFLDTVPDGKTWTNRRSWANDFGTTDFFGGIFGGTVENEGSAYTIYFDNFNTALRGPIGAGVVPFIR